MLTDFQNSFTDRFNSKFATKSSWTILPNVKYVTTGYITLRNINVQKIAMLKNWVKQVAIQDSATQYSC